MSGPKASAISSIDNGLSREVQDGKLLLIEQSEWMRRCGLEEEEDEEEEEEDEEAGEKALTKRGKFLLAIIHWITTSICLDNT